MRYCFVLCTIIFIFGCQTEKTSEKMPISDVVIDTILQDSTLSIRTLTMVDVNTLAFAANNNRFGSYSLQTQDWLIAKHEYDSLELHFRATAATSNDFFMLTIGNPALLFKTTNQGMQLVYEEIHEKVFYDAMAFWNDQEGIAIGDPTDGCMSIIITRDGGQTWQKLSCDKLPNALEGEAAFAASNTNIAISGDHAWVATGGIHSRILHSSDKGLSWDVIEVPIVQGKETTGLYSIDFYDALNGFGIGGDYLNPEAVNANKIRTSDGGETWEIVADNQPPGYRSCVQYIPNSDGKELVAVGFNGIDYSYDAGDSWTHLSDESFFTIRFINDSTAFAAGRNRVSQLHFTR